MNIAEAPRHAGLPATTIRYCEGIGLVMPGRRGNACRDYGEGDLHKLHFLVRARGLGFIIGDCLVLLSLHEDQVCASADVKSVVLARIAEIDRKIAELESPRATHRHLSEACHGDTRPECPTLDGLAGSPVRSKRSRSAN